jgi:cytochrome c-type biogenesis protein
LIGVQHVDALSALLAGLITFFTPCTLPLLPGWLALVAGVDAEALKPGAEVSARRLEVLSSTLLFVLGFGLVFTLLGAAASFLGSLLWDHRDLVRYLGAAVMALFGLHLLGVINIKALSAEKRHHFKARPAGLLGALMVGMAFAAGWTPCSGPVLGAMLSLAWTEAGLWRGVRLLALFSIGLGLPFLALSLTWSWALPLLRRLSGASRWAGRILGAMMLVLAVLVVMDKLYLLNFGFELKTGF